MKDPTDQNVDQNNERDAARRETGAYETGATEHAATGHSATENTTEHVTAHRTTTPQTPTRSTSSQSTPNQSTAAQRETRNDAGSPLSRKRNQQLLAYALIAFGAVLLLNRLGGADWLWLALLGGVFLLGYVSRRTYALLVAGGVLMGVAVGSLIDTQSGMLLSLAAGFFAIDRVEPKPNRWALWTAAVFAVLGALGMMSVTGLLSSVGFALVLIAGGAYLLLRDRQPGFPPRDSYRPPRSDGTEPKAEPETTFTGEVYTPASPAPPNPAPDLTSNPAPSPAPNPVAPTVPTPAEPVPEPEPLSPEAEARLRRLEAWRRETAAAEGTPAYIVFSNDTLTKIAAAEPQTLTELGTVRGVGPVKLERYGEAVLGLVRGASAGESG